MNPSSQSNSSFEIVSPNGKLSIQLRLGEKLHWSVTHAGQPVILPSSISLRLDSGEVIGDGARVTSSAIDHVETQFNAINYRRAVVKDHFARLMLEFAGDFSLEVRAYDDAAAYRFTTRRSGALMIVNEEANFNFGANHNAFIPYLADYREGQVFNASFESRYTEQSLAQFRADGLSILPMLVDIGSGKKAVVLEADLEDYPGMYLNLNSSGLGLQGVFAPYPLEVKRGGFEQMNLIPTQRAETIAKTSGPRAFPWRVIAIGESDKDLLGNDIVQKLAAPSRLEDASWVIPGQVAWDWWSDYNLTHVDFKAGMNTPTFKYFIDFAAANKARYIILDAGWSELFDLNRIHPEVDLDEIIRYGESKGIGVILWACWYAVTQQMREVFPKYAAMGVKGWKIDFIDRDDQIAVASTYAIAQFAAEHKLIVDYHGVFKPTGLQRTYPNVVGYEGVFGLENFKWADYDAPRYDVTVPFTRNMAGPMDYTPGAMTNATQADFKARNHAPMSKGTRCHQLAEYVVFEVPLQMLSDSPSAYMREQECTDFITSVPTIYDETYPLDGRVGEYVAIARGKDSTFFVGVMSNWDARDLTLDFSFLPAGEYQAVVFQDGVNAEREATDYQKIFMRLRAGERLPIHLASGGGWAARIEAL